MRFKLFYLVKSLATLSLMDMYGGYRTEISTRFDFSLTDLISQNDLNDLTSDI